VTSSAERTEVPPCECGAREGEFHRLDCRFELCPFCGDTTAGACECIYDHLGLRRRIYPPDNGYLSDLVYEKGVTAEQRAEWHARCASRGRLPYVYTPQMCARCGVLWPEFFMVQDAAWEYYAGPTLRGQIVCEPCFDALRANIDKHQGRPDWVPSSGEIAQYARAFRARDRDALQRLDPKKFRPGPRGPMNQPTRRWPRGSTDRD